MNKSLVFLLIATSLLTFGCKKNTLTTTQKKLSKLKIKKFDFEYLSAKGKFNYEDEKEDFKSSFDLRIKKDSAIWLSFRTSTGIEGARVLITKDSLTILDRLHKTYRKYGFKELSKITKIKVKYPLFQSILLGNVLKRYERKMRSSKTDTHFVLRQKEEDRSIELFISRISNKLEKAITTDKILLATMSVTYDDFRTVNNELFPFLMKANLSSKKTGKEKTTAVSLKYTRVSLPEKPIRLPFKISSKYKRVIDAAMIENVDNE